PPPPPQALTPLDPPPPPRRHHRVGQPRRSGVGDLPRTVRPHRGGGRRQHTGHRFAPFHGGEGVPRPARRGPALLRGFGRQAAHDPVSTDSPARTPSSTTGRVSSSVST